MSGIRYRKNIDCLTANELHDLREALATMYRLPASDPNSFAKQATFHGGPPTGYCQHGSPGFFTWHRAEVKAFENALRAAGCAVMLPYWDWSSGPSTGIPEACRQPTYANRSGNTVPNPLFSGPRFGGGMTVRSASAGTSSFDDLAAQVQSALLEPSFASFQNLINGPHGSVHVRVGGDMSAVATASYDPIFYLHHANVDRIWAIWQIAHPGPLPADEASQELPPFNRPFSIEWQRGSDVQSTDALGYRYRRLCFYLPPFRIWELVAFPWPPQIRKQFKTARILVKSEQMQEKSIEVRVFLNQPNATVRTKTIGSPGYAGSFGFIGHGAMRKNDAAHCPECALLGDDKEHAHHGVHTAHQGHSHPSGPHGPHGPSERFDIEFDLSDALRKIEAQGDEVSLKLVAVDTDGNEVGAKDFRVEEIELVVD